MAQPAAAGTQRQNTCRSDEEQVWPARGCRAASRHGKLRSAAGWTGFIRLFEAARPLGPDGGRVIRLLCLLAPMLFAGDWPEFRGPSGQGTSPEKGLPTEWGE